MESRNVAAAALAAGVVTMWGTPSAEGDCTETQVQVSVSGTYDPLTRIDDAVLLIWSFSYDSVDQYDVRFQNLGTLDGPGDFSFSGALDICIPIRQSGANTVSAAILGTHASSSNDGVSVGMATRHATTFLNLPFGQQPTFSRVLFSDSPYSDQTQENIHSKIVNHDYTELDRLFFTYFNPNFSRNRSQLPRFGPEVFFRPGDISGGTIERNGIEATFLNFSDATFNGTAAFDISVSLIPEPASISLCLGFVPFLSCRRRR